MASDDLRLDPLSGERDCEVRPRRVDRRLAWLIVAAAVVILMVAGPSLACQTSLPRTILASVLAGYELDADAAAISIGWVTPISVDGFTAVGPSDASVLTVESIHADLTLMDIVRGRTIPASMLVRGVDVTLHVTDGHSSIEDDLRAILAHSTGRSDAAAALRIRIEDLDLIAIDAVEDRRWQIHGGNAYGERAAAGMHGEFSGMLTDPWGRSGSIDGAYDQDNGGDWKVRLSGDSMPVSVVALLQRRFDSVAATPAVRGGDVTGSIDAGGDAAGLIANLRNVRFRDLETVEIGGRPWRNTLASVDGEIRWESGRIMTGDLHAATDFGTATVRGGIADGVASSGGADGGSTWLETIDAVITSDLDIAALDRSLPGLLPIRNGAELVSGRASLKIDSRPTDTGPRCEIHLRTDAVEGLAAGRRIVIDPLDFSTVLSIPGGGSSSKGQPPTVAGLRADRFELQSRFARATGYGDLAGGEASVEIDFGNLSAMLRPLVDFAGNELLGQLDGKIQWQADRGGTWRMTGEGRGSELSLSLSGHSIEPDILRGDIEVVGVWSEMMLTQITSASMHLVADEMKAVVELDGPVTPAGDATVLPLRLQARGGVDGLVGWAGPWLPTSLAGMSGRFDASGLGRLSAAEASLSRATVQIRDPAIELSGRRWSTSVADIEFSGEISLLDEAGAFSTLVQIDSLTAASEAISLSAVGHVNGREIDVDVNYRGDLTQLRSVPVVRVADLADADAVQPPVRVVNHISDQVATATPIAGKVAGTATARGTWDDLKLTTRLDGHGVTADVWHEESLSAVGELTIAPPPQPGGKWLSVNNLELNTDWLDAKLRGGVTGSSENDQPADTRIELAGPVRMVMPKVAERLTALAGIRIDAQGDHETMLRVQALVPNEGDVEFRAETSIGWSTAGLAGLSIGTAEVPLIVNATSITVEPANVPVNGGNIELAGVVHYAPGPMWMRVRPGTKANGVQIEADLTERWLKYVAPLAAGVGRVEGTFDAEIDEASIYFDTIEESRASGRLGFRGVRMTAGPLSQQIFDGVRLIEQLAGTARGSDSNETLLTLPSQNVHFTLDRGVVSHDRMLFQIDRAQLITGGRVTLDGQLDLTAQVPLDPRWLGQDLQGLAGRVVSLPIDGTLSRPSLDSSGVRAMLGQLGGEAIRGAAENYLQEQIGKGMEKLFGF